MPHPIRRAKKKKEIVVNTERQKELEEVPGEPLGDVLMVQVENVPPPKFEETQEIKALKQEIIKSIREIAQLNSLYRYDENCYYLLVFEHVDLIFVLLSFQRDSQSVPQSRSIFE